MRKSYHVCQSIQWMTYFKVKDLSNTINHIGKQLFAGHQTLNIMDIEHWTLTTKYAIESHMLKAIKCK